MADDVNVYLMEIKKNICECFKESYDILGIKVNNYEICSNSRNICN